MRLYHYTCADSAKRISRRGFLRPWPQPLLGGAKVVWLTDVQDPTLVGLGLEPHHLTCDRLAIRYIVDVDDAELWIEVAHTFPLLPPDRLRLERDCQPEHWFIVRRHVFAIQDRSWRRLEASA